MTVGAFIDRGLHFQSGTERELHCTCENGTEHHIACEFLAGSAIRLGVTMWSSLSYGVCCRCPPSTGGDVELSEQGASTAATVAATQNTAESSSFTELPLGGKRAKVPPSCTRAESRNILQSIACGLAHAAIATEDGELLMLGLNDSGQCGSEPEAAHVQAVRCCPVSHSLTHSARQSVAAPKDKKAWVNPCPGGWRAADRTLQSFTATAQGRRSCMRRAWSVWRACTAPATARGAAWSPPAAAFQKRCASVSRARSSHCTCRRASCVVAAPVKQAASGASAARPVAKRIASQAALRHSRKLPVHGLQSRKRRTIRLEPPYSISLVIWRSIKTVRPVEFSFKVNVAAVVCCLTAVFDGHCDAGMRCLPHSGAV